MLPNLANYQTNIDCYEWIDACASQLHKFCCLNIDKVVPMFITFATKHVANQIP
jgi:hypothetical protein